MRQGGLKSYRGGEELRRAAAVLAGPVGFRTEQDDSGGVAESNVPLPPPQLPAPAIDLPASADADTRELAVAAQRYAEAASEDAADFEAVYNHGLALQELATRSSSDPVRHFQLLTQACQRYEVACSLRSGSHACAYNWGVALSDLAKHHRIRGEPLEAEAQLLHSAQMYAASLKWNPNNPQALNNWGLVLQELAAARPLGERDALIAASIAKFRRAIRLRPEFDRACYNLGTVLYSHAIMLQSDVEAFRETSGNKSSGQQSFGGQHHRQGALQRAEGAVDATFQLAAQYIALAQALQPGREVYRKSLQVLRHLLPLPALRSGYLWAADPCSVSTNGGMDSPQRVDERWRRRWFVLDGDSLRSIAGPHHPGSGEVAQVQIATATMTGAKSAEDPSLPAGAAVWLQLTNKPIGEYLVAATQADADGWLDALLLAAHLSSVNRLGALRQTLQPGSQPSAAAAAQH